MRHKRILPQMIAEMDSGGNITSYYVYDGMGLVAKMTPTGAKYFYHYDGSGNTIAMTDSNGTMVNKYAYDEFGNLANAEESIPNPFLFVGQYGVMDDDNGLLYMRARYYDPEVGRFINKDPIRYAGGDANLFCYTENNPINWIDPLGLDPIDPRTGKDNPVMKCHVVTHNDPTENLYGAVIVGGPLTGLLIGSAIGAAGPVVFIEIGEKVGPYLPALPRAIERWGQGQRPLNQLLKEVMKIWDFYQEGVQRNKCPEDYKKGCHNR